MINHIATYTSVYNLYLRHLIVTNHYNLVMQYISKMIAYKSIVIIFTSCKIYVHVAIVRDRRPLTFQKVVVFLILCTAVIKSRVTIYEELFNPILGDAFGFSEDNTAYFFLIILVAPILGGLLL